ncbi:ATP-binding protein [Pseudonocardia humida]|nr:ATP-binding protein [Pseudonocardia humida]
MAVDRDGDARVVLRGTLDPEHVAFVRDPVTALLRDVDRVVVDITALSITSTSVLQVFPDALDAAGGWPAARLALVYRDRTMGQALRASRVARRVAVADEPELALLRCAEQPREVRARWTLPPGLDAPRLSRSRLGLQLASWSCPGSDPRRVEAVLNELVTNAVLHAGTDLQVGLLLDEDGLRVEVRDSHPALPVTDPPSGYGLRVVAALAAQWGVDERADGKTVWARFSCDGRAPGPGLDA